MYSLLITIAIILSVFLVIIILLQSSKGSGLAGTFGGGGNLGSAFGTRRTADFLSKATWWLGGTILVIAILINLFFLPGQMTSDQRESIIQGANQQRSVPTAPSLPEVQSEEPVTAEPTE
ncbi:preprotein translocase subunit SecG [Bacteroidota bacterium]